MITSEKIFLYIMILPLIVIEDTNFHEIRNHVKFQWFLLTIVAFSKTHCSKIPPGTFF